MDRKTTLSTLWIFILFNVIFRDIHELFRPGLIAEMMTGVVNGVELTEGTMLVAGILIEIPIAMVLLSRVLKVGPNRWANIIAGGLNIAFVIANGTNDLDDIWFAFVEIAAMLFIIWYAWTWPKQEA